MMHMQLLQAVSYVWKSQAVSYVWKAIAYVWKSRIILESCIICLEEPYHTGKLYDTSGKAVSYVWKSRITYIIHLET